MAVKITNFWHVCISACAPGFVPDEVSVVLGGNQSLHIRWFADLAELVRHRMGHGRHAESVQDGRQASGHCWRHLKHPIKCSAFIGYQ